MSTGLALWLEHPGLGIASPLPIGGDLVHDLTMYPRTGLTAVLRPDTSEGAIPLWATPYGTRAHITAADGGNVFAGDVITAGVSRPEGGWRLQAADDISRMRAAEFSPRPGQYLVNAPTDLAGYIRALAAYVGVDLSVFGGGLGTVDPSRIDMAGYNAWALVEEQITATGLDVAVGGDGSLTVQPAPVLQPEPDRTVTVGERGTIVRYDLRMSRRYNRVVITHVCQADGQDDKHVDGVWEDRQTIAGVQSVGPRTYTSQVRVGADWWNDPAAHQAQADANAAALAVQVRGAAREAVIGCVPDPSIRVGETVQVTYLGGRTDRALLTGVEWPLMPGGEMMLAVSSPDPGWSEAIDAPLIERPSETLKRSRLARRRLAHAR